ncbi:hypothetical protein BG011_000573 [Mortierella polycephala]|uniref:Uncharacterized protein n=1 Tax=Mortierella polycephala TaxID=41804 RepID=A0A9P6Q8W1_9FUNG|nr:hypothetical protein BG011_000573 [Mortierella polycephala]
MLRLLRLLAIPLLLQAANARYLPQVDQQLRLETKHCTPANIANVVVFGDSISDTGNVYNLTKGAWPRPSLYPDGRFTNGHVWTDYVSQERQFNLINFAHGGATTDSKVVQGYSGSNADIPVPGFIQQIESYSRQPLDPASTMFVVNFQGNDFIFDPSIGSEKVLANIERGIHGLVKLGARHIFVIENFDMGLIPYFQTQSREMSALSKKQHDEYQDMIQRMNQAYGRPHHSKPFSNCPGGRRKTNVAFFDLYTLLQRLNHPRRLKHIGIRDVVHACVNSDYSSRCRHPDRHYYYDMFHFSTKIHRQIANGILKML